MLRIRRAEVKDVPRIMQFIEEHWKSNHIMAKDRTMFEFQHVDDNKVYYIIAEDMDDGKLYGTMGYIPLCDVPYPAMSTVMICALPHPEDDMIGESMARFFEENALCGNLISVGIRKRYALAIDGIEAGHVAKLNHYYRLRDISQYCVAKIEKKVIPKVMGTAQLYLLRDEKEFQACIPEELLLCNKPRRDYKNIIHRYYKHPYYTYNVYSIHIDNCDKGVLVCRECGAQGRKVLRVIDYIGDDKYLAGIGPSLDVILEKNEYEYIDFYCYGIGDAILESAGFVKRMDNDENIIPNYFEPFEQKNADIYFYTWYMEGVHVYKGFGDQDRPNQLAERNNNGL